MINARGGPPGARVRLRWRGMAIQQRRLRVRRLVPLLVVVLVLAGVVGAVWYRYTYHTLAFWQSPPRISYCGRDYQTYGDTTTRSQIEANSAGLPDGTATRLETVGWVPPIPGRDLIAWVLPDDVRIARGLPCTMVLYLHAGGDTYVSYGLLGGP